MMKTVRNVHRDIYYRNVELLHEHGTYSHESSVEARHDASGLVVRQLVRGVS